MRISALAATLLTLAILPVASARAEESAADLSFSESDKNTEPVCGNGPKDAI